MNHLFRFHPNFAQAVFKALKNYQRENQSWNGKIIRWPQTIFTFTFIFYRIIVLYKIDLRRGGPTTRKDNTLYTVTTLLYNGLKKKDQDEGVYFLLKNRKLIESVMRREL